MKMKFNFLSLALFMVVFGCTAQKTVTVKATSYEVSDNLDLEAVASVFGQANNLQHFEQMLNDPEMRLSNLDLNGDGYVDYLRVIEVAENGIHLVGIQAVLGEDLFQDVATIDVERRSGGQVVVQVVGNSYLYGPNYIIQPVYAARPVIFNVLWAPRYVHYVSPYYWGYYPGYYSYCVPSPVFVYHRNVYVHINRTYVYNRVYTRSCYAAPRLYTNVSHTRYLERNPVRTVSGRERYYTASRKAASTRTVASNGRGTRSQTITNRSVTSRGTAARSSRSADDSRNKATRTTDSRNNSSATRGSTQRSTQIATRSSTTGSNRAVRSNSGNRSATGRSSNASPQRSAADRSNTASTRTSTVRRASANTNKSAASPRSSSSSRSTATPARSASQRSSVSTGSVSRGSSASPSRSSSSRNSSSVRTSSPSRTKASSSRTSRSQTSARSTNTGSSRSAR